LSTKAPESHLVVNAAMPHRAAVQFWEDCRTNRDRNAIYGYLLCLRFGRLGGRLKNVLSNELAKALWYGISSHPTTTSRNNPLHCRSGKGQ